jgi:hypothetical protein
MNTLGLLDLTEYVLVYVKEIEKLRYVGIDSLNTITNIFYSITNNSLRIRLYPSFLVTVENKVIIVLYSLYIYFIILARYESKRSTYITTRSILPPLYNRYYPYEVDERYIVSVCLIYSIYKQNLIVEAYKSNLLIMNEE